MVNLGKESDSEASKEGSAPSSTETRARATKKNTGRGKAAASSRRARGAASGRTAKERKPVQPGPDIQPARKSGTSLIDRIFKALDL